MARRRKGRSVNGIVLLNKALGGSSNHVLQQVRRLYQANKGGHTGALDPLASGMLPICLGEATKFSQFLLDADKTYEVTAYLGKRTTTSDADGEVVEEKDVNVSEEQVKEGCLRFLGESKQVPSMYSALKHQGKPLYFYARQGIEIDRPARDITIYELSVDRIALPEVDMTVRCSKGTYIRSLVDDIGQVLGCGAYVTRLHRTQVADYPVENMMTFEQLEDVASGQDDGDYTSLDALLLPMDTAVKSLPAMQLDAQQTHRFNHGQSVQSVDDMTVETDAYYRVYGVSDDQTSLFLGVGQGVAEPIDQPELVRTQCRYVSPRRRVVYD